MFVSFSSSEISYFFTTVLLTFHVEIVQTLNFSKAPPPHFPALQNSSVKGEFTPEGEKVFIAYSLTNLFLWKIKKSHNTLFFC
jgi:hypothetical protein